MSAKRETVWAIRFCRTDYTIHHLPGFEKRFFTNSGNEYFDIRIFDFSNKKREKRLHFFRLFYILCVTYGRLLLPRGRTLAIRSQTGNPQRHPGGEPLGAFSAGIRDVAAGHGSARALPFLIITVSLSDLPAAAVLCSGGGDPFSGRTFGRQKHPCLSSGSGRSAHAGRAERRISC